MADLLGIDPEIGYKIAAKCRVAVHCRSGGGFQPKQHGAKTQHHFIGHRKAGPKGPEGPWSLLPQPTPGEGKTGQKPDPGAGGNPRHRRRGTKAYRRGASPAGGTPCPFSRPGDVPIRRQGLLGFQHFADRPVFGRQWIPGFPDHDQFAVGALWRSRDNPRGFEIGAGPRRPSRAESQGIIGGPRLQPAG
jgi:hypothetical protein